MHKKYIDLTEYPRKDHFEYFMTMENPFANVTAELDISNWIVWLKEKGYPFFLTFQYAVVQAANRVPALRQRYEGGRIAEYDFCNPSFTVPAPDGTYRYCLVHADQPLEAYLAEGIQRQREAAMATSLEEDEETELESLLFTTSLPWLHFSSVTMPVPDRTFTIPNIGWGKYVTKEQPALEDGKLIWRQSVSIPVCLTVNHALADGIHIASFFRNLEEELEKMVREGREES